MKQRVPFWVKRAWLGVCNNSAQVFIAILLIVASLNGGIRRTIEENSDGAPAQLLPMWISWMWSGLLILSAVLIIAGIISWFPRLEMAGITGKVFTGVMSIIILTIYTDALITKVLWLILVLTGAMRYWSLSVIERATIKTANKRPGG